VGLGRSSLVVGPRLAALLSIFLHQMFDPLRQHLTDRDISLREIFVLLVRNEPPASGTAEMRTHLVRGPSSDALEMRAMPICSLAEAFANIRGNAIGTLEHLLPEISVSCPAGPLKDGNYFIGQFLRSLINLQIFEASDYHAATYGKRRARDQRRTTND
jgi:hypothetical protein